MSRYADIEPIIKKIKYSMEVGEQRGYIWLDMVLKDLEKLPIVDAVPMIHSHWEYIGGYGYQYRCAHCIMCAEHKTDFCPHCGAKMYEDVTE